MKDNKPKIVIIDDNAARRSTIKHMLPDYVDVFDSGFGSAANALLMPESDGRIPRVVILNGDDDKKQGYQTYEWMKTKAPNLAGAGVSVIVLTEDEFSDKAMQFLELGDVLFYEGDIDEDEFFSVFVEALESELEEDDVIDTPSYSTDKSVDRLIGLTVSAPAGTEGKPQRSVLINMEDHLEGLESAMEKERKKAESLRQIMADVAVENAVSGKSIKPIRVLDKQRKDHNMPRSVSKVVDNDNDNEEDIPEEFRRTKSEQPKVTLKQSALAQELMFGNRANAMANGGIMTPPPTMSEEPIRKRGTIVVVDDDIVTLRTAKLFLQSQFNVITCESGMKAIDYFVRNQADMLFIDAVMPKLDGIMTLSSIRFQQNGCRVPTVYLVGNDFQGTRERLAGNYVFGTIQKPLTRIALLSAVEQVFSYINRG